MAECQDLSPQKAPRAQALSRERITDVAIAYIESHGVEKLTMRALAGELGCGTMSLYTHISNRDDLLAAVVEALVARSGIIEITTRTYTDWQSVVTDLYHRYRDLAVRYPGSFELLALAPFDAPPVVAHLEGLVDALRRVGLSAEYAYEILGALDAYATGFLTVWARTEVRGQISASPASRELAALRDLASYDRGLRVFIEGYESELERLEPSK